MQIGKCANCKKTKPIKGHGRCVTCLHYRQRTGNERSKKLWRKTPFCKDCRVGNSVSNGRCKACDEYRRLHKNKIRPLYLRSPDLICKNPNCNKPLNLGKSIGFYCNACNWYRLHHDWQDRPERLCKNICTEGYRPCKNPNCDKPMLIGAKRGPYCFGCKNYRQQHGTSRPAHLCSKANMLGWCECGQVAAREIKWEYSITGKDSNEALALCLECFEMDQELARLNQ